MKNKNSFEKLENILNKKKTNSYKKESFKVTIC